MHAVKGDRARYRPIQSLLCDGSRAEDIVDALLQLAPFKRLYIADLDAIQRRGDNHAVIADIRRRFRDLTLWVDAGIDNDGALTEWLARDLGRPVLGSETMSDSAFLGRASRCRPILSLDYREDGFVGPSELSNQAERWPREVIAMTLARVGSNAGPDLMRLDQLRKLAPEHDLFAAGGVRNSDDLAAAAGLGICGVLLASALHNRSITAADLARVHDIA